MLTPQAPETLPTLATSPQTDTEADMAQLPPNLRQATALLAALTAAQSDSELVRGAMEYIKTRRVRGMNLNQANDGSERFLVLTKDGFFEHNRTPGFRAALRRELLDEPEFLEISPSVLSRHPVSAEEVFGKIQAILTKETEKKTRQS